MKALMPITASIVTSMVRIQLVPLRRATVRPITSMVPVFSSAPDRMNMAAMVIGAWLLKEFRT